MKTVELLYISAIMIPVALLLLYQWSLGRELWLARRETSRFPLFAARTHLVQLVVEGKMAEQDPAWQSLYHHVTFMLRMDQSLNIIDFSMRYMSARAAAVKSADLRSRIERLKRDEAEAAQRVPEFGAVRNEIADALINMVYRRTSVRHRILLLALIVIMGTVYIALSAGITTARIVAGSLRRPSTDDFRGWQEQEELKAGCRAG